MATERGMIEPFEEGGKRPGLISYGLSSFGYDIRVTDEFLVCVTNPYNYIIDPKEMNERVFARYVGKRCVIPPGTFALARSLEYFRMPEDTLGIVMGKSTYARCGLLLNTTPLEPGWEGYITLELSNTSALPLVVYAYEGIGQVLFFQSEQRPEITYADRKGKYQSQSEIVLPKVD